jgi:phosphatidate cytidylyltransferase
MSNLMQRVLVALVGIPLVLGALWAGDWAFTLIVVAISAAALWEFYHLAQAKGAEPNVLLGVGLSIALQVTAHASRVSIFPLLLLGMLVVLTVEMIRNRQNALLNVATTLGGIFYITLGLMCLILLRDVNVADVSPGTYELAAESVLILLMFVSVWICDSAAYFVGVAMGRHKIAPRISPKKSWEGAIAGVIGAIAAFVFGAAWLLPALSVSHAAMLGLIAGSVGQIGDLAESWLKRDADIKDSSQLIPGHGGFLDRFDSILFVAPAVYFYWFIIRVTLGG